MSTSHAPQHVFALHLWSSAVHAPPSPSRSSICLLRTTARLARPRHPQVLKKSSKMKLYDERFTGYGKNKIQFIMHLRAAGRLQVGSRLGFSSSSPPHLHPISTRLLLGYRFYSVPRAFVVHVPHKPSEYKKEWANHDSHRSEMNKILNDYANKIKYGL